MKSHMIVGAFGLSTILLAAACGGGKQEKCEDLNDPCLKEWKMQPSSDEGTGGFDNEDTDGSAEGTGGFDNEE